MGMRTETTANRVHLPCPCGVDTRHRPHIVAQRQVADGGWICLWSDGALAQRLGHGFPGVPIVRPRSEAAARAALAAGWLVMGEVECYDTAEVPALYAAARRVAARGGSPGDLRRAFAGKA